MIGTLTKLKDGWYVNYFDIHTYLRLHPEDENLSYAVRDSAWEGKKVNFEVVLHRETSEYYAKLIPSGELKFTNIGNKESQKELIKEIMDLDAKDGLYEDEVSPTYTGEYPFPPKDRYDTVNDIEKLAEQYVNTNYPEYTNPKEKAAAIEDVCWGYNKAKETLYTEEQVREAMSMARKLSGVAYTNDEIIQSLKKLKKD